MFDLGDFDLWRMTLIFYFNTWNLDLKLLSDRRILPFRTLMILTYNLSLMVKVAWDAIMLDVITQGMPGTLENT